MKTSKPIVCRNTSTARYISVDFDLGKTERQRRVKFKRLEFLVSMMNINGNKFNKMVNQSFKIVGNIYENPKLLEKK